jgi:hypothetical protein
MGTGELSSGVMLSESRVHHEIVSSSEVKNSEAVPTPSISLYGIVLNYLCTAISLLKILNLYNYYILLTG